MGDVRSDSSDLEARWRSVDGAKEKGGHAAQNTTMSKQRQPVQADQGEAVRKKQRRKAKPCSGASRWRQVHCMYPGVVGCASICTPRTQAHLWFWGTSQAVLSFGSGFARSCNTFRRKQVHPGITGFTKHLGLTGFTDPLWITGFTSHRVFSEPTRDPKSKRSLREVWRVRRLSFCKLRFRPLNFCKLCFCGA